MYVYLSLKEICSKKYDKFARITIIHSTRVDPTLVTFKNSETFMQMSLLAFENLVRLE